MAYREVSRVEIAEVVRRWQSGISQRGISTGTGLSRATVRRYIEAVVEAGLARDGPAPSEEQLARLAGLSLAGPRKVEIPTEEVLAPWADQVYEPAIHRCVPSISAPCLALISALVANRTPCHARVVLPLSGSHMARAGGRRYRSRNSLYI